MTSITQKCSVDGCDGKYEGKGLCRKHYLREYYKINKIPVEYRLWVAIKGRCYNPNYPNYKLWGGRGIKVCDEWLHDPKAFMDYVGKKPSQKYSLDRINNDGDYEPGNVRWATHSQQIINTRVRSTNTSGFKGVHYVKASNKWTAKMAGKHLGIFILKEDAIEARRLAELKYNCISELNQLKEKGE